MEGLRMKSCALKCIVLLLVPTVALAGQGQGSAGPVADITPGNFLFELAAGDDETQVLNIGNIGDADLDWSIDPIAVDAQGPEVNQRGQRVAGNANWSELGAMGGDSFAVAASTDDPDIVLAGIAPGGDFNGTLYRSTDGGEHWSEVADISGLSVYDIEFAPDGTAYIGTESAVWRSSDDGLTWTRLDLGIELTQRVFAVTLDPSDASTLWITIEGGVQPVNVMRSTDGGETWVDRTPPLDSPMRGRGVAVDPHDPDTVIAVFGPSVTGGAVWVTTDGGDSWTDRTDGLPDNAMKDVVYDGTRLLVGGGNDFLFQFVGLYESYDLGVTWTALHNEAWEFPIVDEIAVDPNDPQTILVATDSTGVHRTTDGGETWELSIGGTGGLFGRALAFAPGSSSDVYLGTSSLGVYRSTDGGDGFEQSSAGIGEMNLFSIAANPLDPNELAASFQGLNNGGVITSTDGGQTWVAEPIPATRSNAVRFAPDGTLYSLNGGPTNIAQEGLYRRESDGSWAPLGPDQGDPEIFQSDLGALRISRTDPQLILAGGRDGFSLGHQAAIWRSVDGGGNWEKVFLADADVSQFITDIEIVEDGTDQVMVAVYTSTSNNQGGALRSVDGGETWLPSSTGLPEGFLREPKLCVSPADPDVIYLAIRPSQSSSSLFLSTDGGASWAATGWSESGGSEDIACDPAEPEVLYHARGGDGLVARSEDGGTTFEPFADGLAGVINLRELSVGGANRLLLASGRGAYETAPHGEICPDPDDVPWLSVAPAAGTTAPEGSTPVDVTADASGLGAGEYTVELCIATNDPANALVFVPVTLLVEQAPGVLAVEPSDHDFGQVGIGNASMLEITVSNVADTGAGILTLSMLELGGDEAFAITGGDCSEDTVLTSQQTCTVEVTFSPETEDTLTGQLTVATDDGQNAMVELDGIGIGLPDQVFSDRFEPEI